MDRAGLSILCYAVLLVMPTLGRMSDQDTYVRLMASHCFANLVTLIAMEVCVYVCMRVYVCACVLCVRVRVCDLHSYTAHTLLLVVILLGWCREPC